MKTAGTIMKTAGTAAAAPKDKETPAQTPDGKSRGREGITEKDARGAINPAGVF